MGLTLRVLSSTVRRSTVTVVVLAILPVDVTIPLRTSPLMRVYLPRGASGGVFSGWRVEVVAKAEEVEAMERWQEVGVRSAGVRGVSDLASEENMAGWSEEQRRAEKSRDGARLNLTRDCARLATLLDSAPSPLFLALPPTTTAPTHHSYHETSHYDRTTPPHQRSRHGGAEHQQGSRSPPLPGHDIT
jgi:hypothetical protein